MIISRTPFRISFVGGGSDLPYFYKKQVGAVLSVSINKYMYIAVHPFFNRKQFQLKYSKTELCNEVDEVMHPIIRQVLKFLRIKGGLEIVSIADIPAGTGLGSSSSFTVGLLNSLYSFFGKFTTKEKLASIASMIEIKKLKEPIGKQDQYAASYGGLNVFTFNKNDSVDVAPINIKSSILKLLEKNLLLFYTKINRLSEFILKDFKEELKKEHNFEIQKQMVELVPEALEALYAGKLNDFGHVLHKSWNLKRNLSTKISNPFIDKYYDIAIKNGALGGKLLGAGGGGFLLFYCERKNQNKLKKALSDLSELRFSFDMQGSKIIYIGERDIYQENGFFE